MSRNMGQIEDIDPDGSVVWVDRTPDEITVTREPSATDRQADEHADEVTRLATVEQQRAAHAAFRRGIRSLVARGVMRDVSARERRIGNAILNTTTGAE